jgi:hypothetical protein
MRLHVEKKSVYLTLCFAISITLAVLSSSLPCLAENTVVVKPGTEIQPLIDANAPGTRYSIQPGVHRLQSIQPRTGDIFEGTPGSILNGARLLEHFQPDGRFWAASVPPPPLALNKSGVPCLQHVFGCQSPVDLFINDVLLVRVEYPSGVTHNKWYFDSAASKVYIADDPKDYKVELSTAPFAFSSSGSAVTIRGLIIEKYANPAQWGAIHDTGKGWLIENNEVRLNHGIGIFINTEAVVHLNHIHHNGQLGIGGAGSDILLSGNQVAYNNTVNFDYMGSDGEAGGIKVLKSRNLVIRNNFVHDNNGPGIWLDTDNVDWKVEGNRLSDNREAGILAEVSYSGIIRFNSLENERDEIDPLKTGLWWQAGIMIESSGDAEVYGNTLIRCGNGIGIVSTERGSGVLGPYVSKNISVYDNTIVLPEWTASGLVADVATQNIHAYSSWNNHFAGNRYMFLDTAAAHFAWYTGGTTYRNISLREWQQAGQDAGAASLLSGEQITLIQQFVSGDHVTVNGSAVQQRLSSEESPIDVAFFPGKSGTITSVSGPIHYRGDWWWHLSYDTGVQGWSPGSSLHRELQDRDESASHRN